MEIRALQDREILPALHLVWDVFVEDVAPLYTPEGVAEFQRFIKYDSMYSMVQSGEITFFGAFEGEALCGIMAVKKGGHICLFYVKKEWQGKGLGRLLFEAVERHCFFTLRVKKITVNAAIGAVEKYKKLGFYATQDEVEKSGMRYLPMELQIDARNIKTPLKRSKAPIIIAAVIGVISLFVLVGIFFMFFAVKDVIQSENHSSSQQIEPYEKDSDDFDDYTGDADESQSGIASIEVYEDPDTTYKVEEKEYTFSDSESKATIVDFQVKYPNITGLDEDVAQKVNEALKNCAMDTVSKIYTNPSDEIKERVLEAKVPALVSHVQYKVTYISKDFISVVFEDYSYQGSSETMLTELRTKNINLKDGTSYEVKDIVTIDDAFLSAFRVAMEDEADNAKFLSELTDEDLKKALQGDSLNGVYKVVFFADKEGVEIGYSLNYPSQDANDLGYAWVTAPFDYEEIEAYKINGGMWDALK